MIAQLEVHFMVLVYRRLHGTGRAYLADELTQSFVRFCEQWKTSFGVIAEFDVS